MSVTQANGERVSGSYISGYLAAAPTTAAFVDVQFEDESGDPTGPAFDTATYISLQVQAIATVQDAKIRVMERASREAAWIELVAEADVTTSQATTIYNGNARGSQMKIQLKQGSSPGGLVDVSFCLK
tara:strand:+ start:2302 stop:2685 length:384 start_codon:yes stop_codon:yes gene_type:complete